MRKRKFKSRKYDFSRKLDPEQESEMFANAMMFCMFDDKLSKKWGGYKIGELKEHSEEFLRDVFESIIKTH